MGNSVQMRGWEAGGDYAIGGAVGDRGTDSCGRAESCQSWIFQFSLIVSVLGSYAWSTCVQAWSHPECWVFPQQRKLMGSSAQNSSGVHWCRCRVSFNEVPEKVTGEGSRKPWCKAKSGSTGFWRRFWRRFRRRLGRRFRRRSQGFGEGSGEGLGSFGAEPGQVQQGSGEGSGEGSREGIGARSGRLWCRARSGSTRLRRTFLGGFRAESGQVQQGSGEGSGEGLGSFGAEPGQVQQGSGEGSGEGSREGIGARSGRLWCRARSGSEKFGRLWCRGRSGSTGFRRRFRRRSGRLWSRAEVFPALGFAARFRNICQNKALWLLGIPPELIFCQTQLKETLRSCNSMCVYIYISTSC